MFVEPPSEPFNPPCGPSCLWPAKSEWQQWRMNKRKQRRPANTSPKRQNTPMSDFEFSQERPRTEKISRRLTQNLVFSIFDVFSGCPKRIPQNVAKGIPYCKHHMFLTARQTEGLQRQGGGQNIALFQAPIFLESGVVFLKKYSFRLRVEDVGNAWGGGRKTYILKDVKPKTHPSC